MFQVHGIQWLHIDLQCLPHVCCTFSGTQYAYISVYIRIYMQQPGELWIMYAVRPLREKYLHYIYYEKSTKFKLVGQPRTQVSFQKELSMPRPSKLDCLFSAMAILLLHAGGRFIFIIHCHFLPFPNQFGEPWTCIIWQWSRAKRYKTCTHNIENNERLS